MFPTDENCIGSIVEKRLDNGDPGFVIQLDDGTEIVATSILQARNLIATDRDQPVMIQWPRMAPCACKGACQDRRGSIYVLPVLESVDD